MVCLQHQHSSQQSVSNMHSRCFIYVKDCLKSLLVQVSNELILFMFQVFASCHRRAVVHSSLHSAATMAVMNMCWGLGMFWRSPSHPPLALLQDLHLPSSVQHQALRMSVVVTALGQTVLCLAFWPGCFAAANQLAGWSS